MRRRSPRWPVPIGLALALGALSFGCGGDGPPPLPKPRSYDPDRPGGLTGGSAIRSVGMDPEMRQVLLNSVVNLLEDAPLTPGGNNIKIATENLNNYFKSNEASDFLLTPESRAYLEEELADFPPFPVDDFEVRRFEQKDARHIEDCLLYHNIASRAAGPGSTLDRVRRLFEWSVANVQLVPPEAPIPQELIAQGINPVPARPYDVIVRGFGSEQPGSLWAERSWVFIALCRQIGVDAAMLAYPVEGREEPYSWTCAALIDGVPRLFDTRIGLEIPGPDGSGIATLEEAATDPLVLGRLDLPSPAIPYPTGPRDLGRIRVLIDSSRGYFSPKMKLLQDDLAGSNRMVLHRDPAEQRGVWESALGDRLEAVSLWTLPLTVEFRLFNDPAYVRAIQFVNAFFSPDFPLLGARLLQLRGDLTEAKKEFTRARFRRELAAAAQAGQVPPEVIREVQESIDLFATYFLALAQFEEGQIDPAINLFEQALTLPPTEIRVVRGRPATLLRLGAEANLGRLYEAKEDVDRAIFSYTRSNPTPQSIGNLIRANALVFEDPFGPPPPPFDPSAAPIEADPPAVDDLEAGEAPPVAVDLPDLAPPPTDEPQAPEGPEDAEAP